MMPRNPIIRNCKIQGCERRLRVSNRSGFCPEHNVIMVPRTSWAYLQEWRERHPNYHRDKMREYRKRGKGVGVWT